MASWPLPKHRPCVLTRRLGGGVALQGHVWGDADSHNRAGRDLWSLLPDCHPSTREIQSQPLAPPNPLGQMYTLRRRRLLHQHPYPHPITSPQVHRPRENSHLKRKVRDFPGGPVILPAPSAGA